jgi:hypothetical protein
MESIIVSAGHAEYGAITEGVTEVEIWAGTSDSFDENDQNIWDTDVLAAKFLAASGETPGDWDLGWEHIVRLEGDYDALVAFYNSLVTELSETPHGDDTTYDYYPSGVRYALEIAAALELSTDTLVAAVHAAIDGMDAAEEIADKTGIFS